MLIIRRTESQIEFTTGEAKSTLIDTARISSAMLAAERLPCGTILHTLLLTTAIGCDPVRLEGELGELADVYCYLVEAMRASEASCQPRSRLH
ncbi:MAG: hypothetical protein AB7O43_12210 [Hyphomicrobiaceae bacterium]